MTGVLGCATAARDAAGDADVMVHGAGKRLFDLVPAEVVELELVRKVATTEVTHVRYGVHRG